MPRDPALELAFRDGLGPLPEVLTERPMFGGLCFMLGGNMIGAARQGRAMYRVGAVAEPQALALAGTEPMTHGGRAKPGYVWLSGPALSDPAIRRALARMAVDFTRTLPEKDHAGC